MTEESKDTDEPEDNNTKPFDHRKVWGAGFHAGMKKALGEDTGIGDTMNATRFKSIFQNLSSTEKRMLDVLPLNDFWSERYIRDQYNKVHESSIGCRSILHCLTGLETVGLARKDERNYWQRTPGTKHEVETVTSTKPSNVSLLKDPTPPPKTKEVSPIDSAFKHITQFREVLDLLESDLLAIDEELKNKNADMEKMDQLKALLNSIKS